MDGANPETVIKRFHKKKEDLEATPKIRIVAKSPRPRRHALAQQLRWRRH